MEAAAPSQFRRSTVMKTLTGPWADLHALFLQADRLPATVLQERIAQLDLPLPLCRALDGAICNKTEEMVSLLFTAPPAQQDPVVLFVPINVLGERRYAWMIGTRHSRLLDIRRRFDAAREAACLDTLLVNRADPPPVLFVDVQAVSTIKNAKSGADTPAALEDFSIFRASNSSGMVGEDVDRQLLQNATLIHRNVLRAHRAARRVFGDSLDGISACLERDAELFGLLHVEAHNRGHFAGPWPFRQGKSGPMHDPIEEFRACLCAVRWGEYLDLSLEQRDAFAANIFLTRFLYYGVQAYGYATRTRQSIRETSVGLMFFEVLRQAGAIQERSDSTYSLDVAAVRPVLYEALKLLHAQEGAAKERGPDGLREVARHWYRIAYPMKQLSQPAQRIYDASSRGGDSI